MKTLIVSLAALMAVSGAALASDRGYDLRDSDTYFGKYSSQMKDDAASYTSTKALAMPRHEAGETAFERLKRISEENEHGRK